MPFLIELRHNLTSGMTVEKRSLPTRPFCYQLIGLAASVQTWKGFLQSLLTNVAKQFPYFGPRGGWGWGWRGGDVLSAAHIQLIDGYVISLSSTPEGCCIPPIDSALSLPPLASFLSFMIIVLFSDYFSISSRFGAFDLLGFQHVMFALPFRYSISLLYPRFSISL